MCVLLEVYFQHVKHTLLRQRMYIDVYGQIDGCV